MYELWDLTTRNVSGFFDTKAAALAAVRHAVKAHGQDYAEALALLHEDRRGQIKAVADRAALVDLALRKESAAKRPQP